MALRSARLLPVLTLIFVASALVGTRSASPGGTVGTLRVSLPGPIKSLDPALGTDRASRLMVANVYERLYAYHHLKRPFELVPSLAADLPEASDDGLTWSIRLRKGLRFQSDPCFGAQPPREIQASDAVFCFLRLMDAGVGSDARWVFRGAIEGIDAFTQASADVKPVANRDRYVGVAGFPEVAGLRAVDSHTLRIRLTRPNPDFPWILASTYASIYPREAVAFYGRSFGQKVVGTGPYRLQAIIPDRSLTLVADPAYREEAYPGQGARGDAEAGYLADAGAPLPRNSMVVATIRSDPVTEWLSFVKGKIDVCEIPTEVYDGALDLSTLELLPHLVEKGVTLQKAPRLEIFYDAFNMKDPILGHAAGEKGLAIRRAITLAVNDEWTMQRVYRNAVLPVDGVLLDEFPESDPTFQAPWKRQRSETWNEARDAAREVLAEAGYADGKEVPTLQMDVLDDPGSRQIFDELRKNLLLVGVRVEPVFVSWAEMRSRVADGKARMWSSSWEADYPAARNFLQLFHGTDTPDPLGGGYTNPEFDELYADAQALAPGEERRKLYREMQELIAQDCPWRFRFRRQRLIAAQPWLINFRANDITPAFFKYCRVDTAMRGAWLEKNR